MLVAIISIYWISGTTDVVKLYELGIDAKYQNLLWLAFLVHLQLKLHVACSYLVTRCSR